MIRRIERIRRRSGRQQAAVPREKVLEAQVGHEVPCRRRQPAVELLPVASQHQRLRLVLPLQALDIKPPQVPFCARDVGAVAVQVLHRQRRNLRRARFQRTQIPLRHRYFRCVHGLHDQFVKGILRGRKRRGRQEPREFGKHRLQREITCPHAQVSMVGHGWLKLLGLYRASQEVANRQPDNVEQLCGGTTILGSGNIGFQLPVLALFVRAGGSVGGVKPCDISLSRSSRKSRSEEHTSELQSHVKLVCRLLIEKKKTQRVKDRLSERLINRN